MRLLPMYHRMYNMFDFSLMNFTNIHYILRHNLPKNLIQTDRIVQTYKNFFAFRALFKVFPAFSGVVKMVVEVCSSQWVLACFLFHSSHPFSILALGNDVQNHVSFFISSIFAIIRLSCFYSFLMIMKYGIGKQYLLAAPGTRQAEEEQFLSNLFIYLGIFFVVWLLVL